MKKSYVAGLAAALVVATGVTGASVAQAHQNGTGRAGDSSMVQAIADKFKLNKDDVQKVMNEQRTKMQAERAAERTTEVKTELAQLVQAGKLTQAQSDAILAKRAELQKQREADRATMQSKTAEERRAAMDARRAALDTWLKEQGIDSRYRDLLMGGFKKGHGMSQGQGSGDHMGMGNRDTR